MISMKIFKKKTREKIRKGTALGIVFTLLFEIMAPTATYALTGGPSQPEVQGFTPVGTSDMVDLFSGDFSYNIPLLDIDGYPINIAYNAGVGMDDEASWVGLGWSLNPGVVNRTMRGLPDDFAGDVVTKEYNMKPNRTFGLDAGFGAEILGDTTGGVVPFLSNSVSLSGGASVGLRWNNYTGIGIEKSINLSISAGNKSAFPLGGGLGISSSSDNGLGVQPSVELSKRVQDTDKNYYKSLTGKVGVAFNSRMGLSQLTFSGSFYKKFQGTSKKYGAGTYRTMGSLGSYGFEMGMPTYTPDVSMPMNSFGITGTFKFGGELLMFTGTYDVGGYYSVQSLNQTTRQSPAYGYMNSDAGQANKDALLDFNRENEGSFMSTTPALAVSNYTYDLFSVSGQGVGGSYRPFRSDVGHIFDPFTSSSSNSGSIGVELAAGMLYKGGVDISVTHVTSTSGDWTANNEAGAQMSYKNSFSNPLNEKYYFKEANEKSVQTDNSFYAKMGGADPVRFNLVEQSKFNTYADDKFVNQNGGQISINDNFRQGREKRNNVFSFLSRAELSAGMGIENPHGSSYSAPGHHIAEVTSLGADGRRYIYGIAAYNTMQKDVSFAVGENLYGGSGLTGDCNNGQVIYGSLDGKADNSKQNQRGIDNYFSSTEIPAYAHSYLLTCVLSSDYVDADNIKGPSKGDLGTYVKFNYTKVNGYKWRTPVGEKAANYSEGLKSDPNDDKASYSYGEKELWYVESIETKNYVAVFTTEDRADGYGVNGQDGGISSSNAKMKLLRKISLYSKPDYEANGTNATPLKEVHFEYDYSLCPNAPNNINTVNGSTDPYETGKLTLKRIYFTYQNSNKGKFSPYKFEYNSLNPEYNLKGYDRWGNYKPNAATNCAALSGTTIPTAEYPYVIQDKSLTDQYASAWSLTDIFLPSGGKIHVDYESDDYAYVQHKKASQMFKIIRTEEGVGNGITASISDGTNKNRKIYFELQPGYNNINDYFSDMQLVYFRCLMEFDEASGSFPGRHDYVSGYAEIDSKGIENVNGTDMGWVKFKAVKLNDNGNTEYNPISKAAIQFGRMHLSRYVWDQPAVTENDGFGADVLNTLVNSSFFKNIGDAVQGPNHAIWSKERGRKLVLNKSWIRLFNPNNQKLGGGCRVKKISMSDEWNSMTGGQMDSYDYGQEYFYTNEDGTSSGVASYEPQLGGDENTFKQPIFFTNNDPDKKIDNLLVPEESYYQEEPLGESFFPSPSVGYSRVTVRNIKRTDVSRTATGKVVHEFYTAKDFPTIVKRTELNHIRNKNNPFSVSSLFHMESRDHMTASQGFVVELNDMHGKPKKQMVYQENQNVPITEVEYNYQKDPLNLDGKLNYRLKNSATVIRPDGTTANAEIGVFFDMVADMRENYNRTFGGAVQINADGFLAAIIPVVIPMIYPSVSTEETQFRSATTTKVIQRFGILEETKARDLGSVVSTKNIAYDSETGDVLLTQTTTDFNDAVYSLTYPSHWYYDLMGQAYKNISFKKENVTFNSNGMMNLANAHLFFAEGDEVIISQGTSLPFIGWQDNLATAQKAWLTDVTSTTIKAVKKDGSLITGGPYSIKVVRSGRRNMQAVPIASITTLKNPLTGLTGNIFENVLQSSAIEFSQDWRTFCDCFDDPLAANYTTNPYVLGTKGNWRMSRSWLHLSSRTQSNYDNNTNIRKDGMFTSYTPFYKLTSGKWNIDERNWTFTSEVTEFSPFGQELENKDALGRYSAATFGFNQTLATSVAANSRYRELGFDAFEDYDFGDCSDDHFKFRDNPVIVNTQSHTGRKSIKVSAGTPVVMNKQFENCEPEGCTLELSPLHQLTSTLGIISVTNGTAPYNIEYDIVNGNPAVNIDNQSTQISLTGSGYTITITVTDMNGCKVLQTYTKN